MYRHILLAVALQHWDELSPHAVAAREAAVALARGSGAKLSVLSVYDYGRLEEPGLPLEMSSHGGAEVMHQLEAARKRREEHIRQLDAQMETKMQAFLAGVPTHKIPLTPLLKVGHPRDVLLGGTATAVSRHVPCAVVMVQPGVVNLFVLISSGGNRGTRADQSWTEVALRQPPPCP
jgi:nucleotide-binding universal stress UspA family protein